MKQRVFLLAVLVVLLFMSSGCSVIMATKQPDYKNLNVLDKGTPRSKVIAELGAPTLAEVDGGKKKDIFAFKQGYSTGNKVSRALFHAAADVWTLGLWEVIGTPAEAIASGRNIKVEIVYDKDDDVESVRYIEEKNNSQTEKKKEDVQVGEPKDRFAGGNMPQGNSFKDPGREISTVAEYHQHINKTIATAIVKPRTFEPGVVKAAFTLRSDGVVDSIKFLEGSAADPFLRVAVANAINGSSPFPPFPESMREERFKTFTMAIEFK